MSEHFKLASPHTEAGKRAESKEATPNLMLGKPNGDDPFSDIKNLVVPQSYLGAVKVKKVLSTVATDKPSKQTFFRIREGEEYTAEVGILKHEEEGKLQKRSYLVLPQMFDALSDDLTHAQIFLGQTKQGAYFLWPVTLPKDGADMSEWSATALEHIEVAKTVWIRIGRNKESNGYARTEAETPFPDPTWEDLPLIGFMRIAFRGEGVIASPDHPIVLKWRGKA